MTPSSPTTTHATRREPQRHPHAERPSKALAELVLIRGFPGSGKSTMARVLALVGYDHYEADMFFVVNGKYLYDGMRIKDAHAWCQDMTRRALTQGRRVVVANTFTRLHEMAPYRAMTTDVRVIEARGRWQNVHGVLPETMRRMEQRWEPLSEAAVPAEATGR